MTKPLPPKRNSRAKRRDFRDRRVGLRCQGARETGLIECRTVSKTMSHDGGADRETVGNILNGELLEQSQVHDGAQVLGKRVHGRLHRHGLLAVDRHPAGSGGTGRAGECVGAIAVHTGLLQRGKHHR